MWRFQRYMRAAYSFVLLPAFHVLISLNFLRAFRPLAAVAGVAVCTGLACAADAPPTPGSVQESIPARPAAPAAPAQVILPEQPGPTPHDRNGRRFQVHSFRFVGHTAFPAQRLKQVVARFVDLELNLYDLNLAADAVTEFYHDRGYSLARAVIPAQRVDDGVVTIAVVEGRVGKVLFAGNKSYDDAFLRGRVGHLAGGSLVTTDRMERSLLLLNDLPGLKARATLSPAADFGASDVLVRVEEQRLAANVILDNAGRRETGTWRLDAGLEINNLLGQGEQLSLRALTTDHRLMKYGKVGFAVPLDGDGLKLSASHSNVRYDVAGTFAALGMEGSARTTEAALQYPLTRSRGKNETLSLALKSTHLVQKVMSVETSNVRVPMLVGGYVLNRIGNDASVSNLSIQVASNFRRNMSGLSQTAQQFRGEVDGNYLLPLDRQWDVYLRAAVAYSPDRLPDSEKYAIGGPGSVRAYRASELRGDSGAQATLEFRRRLKLGTMPGTLALFGDTGRAVYKMPGFSDGWESIAAWGAGVSLYPARQTVFKVEAAVPGGGRYRAADGRRGRIWASINTSF